jgi:hypothetical protein
MTRGRNLLREDKVGRIAQYKGLYEYEEFISLAKVQTRSTNMRFLGCLWKVFVRDRVKTKEVRNILREAEK